MTSYCGPAVGTCASLILKRFSVSFPCYINFEHFSFKNVFWKLISICTYYHSWNCIRSFLQKIRSEKRNGGWVFLYCVSSFFLLKGWAADKANWPYSKPVSPSFELIFFLVWYSYINQEECVDTDAIIVFDTKLLQYVQSFAAQPHHLHVSRTTQYLRHPSTLKAEIWCVPPDGQNLLSHKISVQSDQ